MIIKTCEKCGIKVIIEEQKTGQSPFLCELCQVISNIEPVRHAESSHRVEPQPEIKADLETEPVTSQQPQPEIKARPVEKQASPRPARIRPSPTPIQKPEIEEKKAVKRIPLEDIIIIITIPVIFCLILRYMFELQFRSFFNSFGDAVENFIRLLLR